MAVASVAGTTKSRGYLATAGVPRALVVRWRPLEDTAIDSLISLAIHILGLVRGVLLRLHEQGVEQDAGRIQAPRAGGGAGQAPLVHAPGAQLPARDDETEYVGRTGRGPPTSTRACPSREKGHNSSSAVFGYDNVRGFQGDKKLHTDQKINPAQADTIRRIFQMYSAGHGHVTIACCRNGDPRSADRPGIAHAGWPRLRRHVARHCGAWREFPATGVRPQRR